MTTKCPDPTGIHKLIWSQLFAYDMSCNDRKRQKRTFGKYIAPSEDSDQPAHSHNLIRIFTGRILDSQEDKVSLCGQQRLWSDCTEAQADFSFRCVHMSEGTFLSGCGSHNKHFSQGTWHLLFTNFISTVSWQKDIKRDWIGLMIQLLH